MPSTFYYNETDIADVTPSVSEADFKNGWLPILLYNSDPVVFNSRWISEVAYSPTARVRVIDTTGKTLFTVPPLVTPNKIHLTHSEELTSMIGRIHQMKDVNPPKANMLLAETLDDISASIAMPQDISYVDEWNNILIRYGYGDLIADTATIANKVEESVVLNDIGEDW